MGSSLLYAPAPLDAIVHQTGLKGVGRQETVGHIDRVVRIDQKRDIVIHLRLVGGEEFLIGPHLLHLAGVNADLLPLILSVGEDKLQGSAHIEKGSVVPSVRLARNLGFHAADNGVIPGILEGDSPVHQSRNDHFVIVVSGETDPCSGQISRPAQKVMG